MLAGRARPLDTFDLEARLNDLHIPLAVLMSAAERALMAHRECHPLAAPTAPGFLMWVEYNASLAEELMPLGWVIAYEQNVPLLTHPKSQAVITGSAGTAATGLRGGKPQKRSVGSQTEALIDEGVATQKQLDLDLSFAPINPAYTVGRLPWFAFYFLDESNREFRHGLYLPEGIRDNRIIDYTDSIALPVIALDDVTVADIRAPEAGAPEIDIEIQRRA